MDDGQWTGSTMGRLEDVTCHERCDPGRRCSSKRPWQLPLKFEVVYRPIMSGLLQELCFMRSQLPAFVCVVLFSFNDWQSCKQIAYLPAAAAR